MHLRNVFTILVSVLLPFLLLSGIFTYFVFYRKYVNKNKISNIATLDYISKKQKIAYSDDVGVVLFRCSLWIPGP